MNPSAHAREWLPRPLARARARSIGELRYHLAVRIRSGRGPLAIDVTIDFTLARRAPRAGLLLDWRPRMPAPAVDRARRTLTVNNNPVRGAPLHDGHLLLPASALRRGANRVTVEVSAPIGSGETAITRFTDPADRAEYIYTLFVPADASTVFPCFDQPDLKARFTLQLSLPASWRAIANAPIVATARRGGVCRYEFAATEPLSTYVFAFAAGPFVPLAASDRNEPIRLWVRRSQRRIAQRHAADVLALNRRALDFCSRYFAHRFPFAKYDLVLIPHFPFRGMEHAGAAFLNEASVLLARDCTAFDRLQRAQLVFHETAHQWMGDLVTMRWFDDLWIKEGFANFMAYKLAARVFPDRLADTAFHALKASAYDTDQTRGATPLHARLSDLAHAKALYGNIVYAKAPAVLQQLEFTLGARAFRSAVRAFVDRHAYACADWHDLVDAFARACGRSLDDWARAWILDRGVPRLRLRVGFDQRARKATIRMHQTNTPRHAPYWPLRVAVRVTPGPTDATLDFDRRRIAIAVKQQRRPATCILNHDDRAYLVPEIDSAAIDTALVRLARSRHALDRMLAWTTLWQAVRDARLAPATFVRAALRHLCVERNEVILGRTIEQLRTTMDTLLGDAHVGQLASDVEALAWHGATAHGDAGLRRLWLRGFVALARTSIGVERLVKLLHDAHRVDLRPHARSIAVTLVLRGVLGVNRARARLPAVIGDADTRACLAAAVPALEHKRSRLSRLIDDRSRPEAAIIECMSYLFHPAHAHTTQPLLPAALDAVEALAERRKIFFVHRWIAIVIGGQSSAGALDLVRRYTTRSTMRPDLRLKVLEAADGLARTVAIRERFTDPDAKSRASVVTNL